MAELPPKLLEKLEKRHLEDSLRSLPQNSNLVDFSSNDYLGFARNGKISEDALKLLQKHELFNGATGSRLLTGNHELYNELEQLLADFHKASCALVYNSGYDANIGFFSSVPQRGDVVFYDELIHASIRDGIQMGTSKSYKFAHNDLDDLEQRIKTIKAKSQGFEIYVVTESVFSMDGDVPNLKKLVELCQGNGAHLIVDEAHATGVFGNGKGMLNELGLENEVFARVITFGKAFGCHGAAILGANDLKQYLINFSRSLIYTTALPPHSIATILAAYARVEDNGGVERKKLMENIQYFKKKVVDLKLMETFIPSSSAIHCAVVPGNKKVRQISLQLQDAGFNIKPILSPTVKKGAERLRFCLHAYNTKEEISEALFLLKKLIFQ